jgi:hypothetical protein
MLDIFRGLNNFFSIKDEQEKTSGI